MMGTNAVSGWMSDNGNDEATSSPIEENLADYTSESEALRLVLRSEEPCDREVGSQLILAMSFVEWERQRSPS